jgi:2-O-(6-phospho-alpha-D-mannosyl)-D-glycerate hydrolase
MINMSDDLKIHVVSHSHWDREWRQPLEFFQPYLVKCMDQLLDILDKDPDYKAFLLDGQSVMLEDYLDIRPEKLEITRQYLKEGRILVGPWYSLVDNNLIAGESIVRNLLYGTRMASRYGACMKEGYLISSFGHCGQIPQIFAGFGIESVLFSRGISEWQTRSELLWESPDGTRALALHLPDRYTKSNWFYLVHRPGCVGREAMDWTYHWPADGPVHACDADSSNHYWWRTQENFIDDKDNWIKCVNKLIEKCLSVSTIPILLAMDGVDHLFPHEEVPNIIKAANEHFGREVLVHSDLSKYISDVRGYLDNNKIELEVRNGEMRRPMKVPGFNQLLAGTISARMKMKLMNHKAETFMIRLAEPACSMAFLNGKEYPKAFLDKAWKQLMVNHAHDGICGTSTDSVHEAMEDRYRRATDLCDFLTYEALKEIVIKIDTSKLDEKELAMTVFNTTGFSRSRLVKAVVDIPYKWKAAGVEILDMEENAVPYYLISKQKQEREILADHDAQLGFLALRIELEFYAKDLPAFGYKTYKVRPGVWPNISGKKEINGVPAVINSGPLCIENGFLKIKAESDGSISITDKSSGKIYTGLNVFTSSGDIGDSTTYIKPMGDKRIFSTGFGGSIEIIDEGPLSSSIRIIKRMQLPAYCEPKSKFVELVETAQPFKAHRSKDLVEEIITSTVTLCVNSKRIDIKTVIENEARDHRIRVLFPTGANNAKTWIADAPFDAVTRNIELPDTQNWAEAWPETQPIQSWCAVSDENCGLAIFTKGIPGAACFDDEKRTLALTLLRCTRRSIGEDYSLEGAQSLGRFEFDYSITPFTGRWEKEGLPEIAADVITPIRALLSASGRKGCLPCKKEYLKLESPDAKNLSITCIKKSEEGEGLIVRLFNPTKKEITLSFQRSVEIGDGKCVKMDEVTVDDSIKKDADGNFIITPYNIVTVLFKE